MRKDSKREEKKGILFNYIILYTKGHAEGYGQVMIRLKKLYSHNSLLGP